MAKLKIRKDRTSTVLRKLAKSEPDARISRRLLGIANALDGMSRAEAAKCAGMDRQTLRDWVIRYDDTVSPGSATTGTAAVPPMLTLDEQAELLAIVMAGPDPEKDGFCAFTRDDLVAIAKKKFGKSMHPASMGRVLRRLDLSRQKARPTHPMKNPAAAAAFKEPGEPWKKFSVRLKTSACASISRTRRASGRRAASATSGGSAASDRRACSTSAMSTPTSTPPSSPAPTTRSR